MAVAVAAAGHETFGLCRSPVLDPAAFAGGRLLTGSLLDPGALRSALAEARPAVVVHAAGSPGGPAGAAELFELNVLATERLLEAAGEAGVARVVVAGSSAVYGATRVLPVDEEVPPAPASAYGASKLAQEMVARGHEMAGGPEVVIARLFNLVGPGQRGGAVLAQLAAGVVEFERGRAYHVPVGDRSARRDLVDVRDAARALALLAVAQGKPGVVNVASGRSTSVAECCELLAGEAGAPLDFRTDPTRLRPSEVAEQVGSYARLHQLTGWEPEVPLTVSVRDTLADWRGRPQEKDR